MGTIQEKLSLLIIIYVKEKLKTIPKVLSTTTKCPPQKAEPSTKWLPQEAERTIKCQCVRLCTNLIVIFQAEALLNMLSF